MKSVFGILFVLSCLYFIANTCSPAFAQSPVAAASPFAPTNAPAVVAPAAAPAVSGTLIATLLAAVACLNVALSAAQQIFSALSKNEPSWLTSVSKIVLAVSKYLGSNPNV